MSKDDLRSAFSSNLETNNSRLTSSQPLRSSLSFSIPSASISSKQKKTKTLTPSKSATKRSRHQFDSEKIFGSLLDDDVDVCAPKKKSQKTSTTDEIRDSDSDSSVLIVGSLADERKRTQSTSNKSSFVATSLSVNANSTEKRNETNQILQSKTPTPLNSMFVSQPRRSGTSAADRRVRTERSSRWVSVSDMCTAMGIDGNFTGVDIGTVNMGIIQISCIGSSIRILDWKLLNLSELCKKIETDNPQELFATGVGAYGNESHCHCLYKWVCEQSRNNGIFDSSVVIIEAQSFSREMKAIQTAIHCAVIQSKPAILVRLNAPGLDLREANFVSPAHIVSANSVKTCYSAFFPRVTGTSKPSSAFGMGDAYRNNNGNPDDSVGSAQYRANKKNAVKYGAMLISVDKIISTLGTKITADEAQVLRKKKRDDIYDALWIVLYGIETWLPQIYGRRIRGMGAKNTMYGALAQRRYRTCDAMFEFAAGIGTSAENVAELRRVLTDYQTTNNVDDDDEDDTQML